MDLRCFFGYQGIRFAKEKGLVGFIAPNNWITNMGASLFRNLVWDNAKIITYTDFGSYKVVDQMLATQEQLNSTLSDSDKKFLQQRVDILDKQVNTIVYGLIWADRG